MRLLSSVVSLNCWPLLNPFYVVVICIRAVWSFPRAAGSPVGARLRQCGTECRYPGTVVVLMTLRRVT